MPARSLRWLAAATVIGMLVFAHRVAALVALMLLICLAARP
jgi:hypothetical protein